MAWCPHCNEWYDEDNESQPCCGLCGHPITCSCGSSRSTASESTLEELDEAASASFSEAEEEAVQEYLRHIKAFEVSRLLTGRLADQASMEVASPAVAASFSE